MKSSHSSRALCASGRRHGIVLLALSTSLTCFTSFVGALAGAQQTPTFRTRTDLVELDVSVLDKDRKPVRGLTQADFTVFEDGKPQQISVFEAVDVPGPTPPPVAWMRDVTPDVDTNETKVTRLWVLVVDDALIPTEPYAITTSLKVVREIIDKFGPNDMAAIVFTTDSRKAQDFTNDRTKLLAALDQFNPGWANWTAPPKWQKENPDWQFQGGAVRTLQNVMDTVSALPHHRKAMIWVSAGISMGFASPLLDNPANFDDESLRRLQATIGVFDGLKEMWETAQRANVPIYPIHPCGLIPPGGADKCTAAMSGVHSLNIVALNTGGRAVTETNDYSPGIRNIFDENSSYYLIGYSPGNTKSDGKFRRLEVKVHRDDVAMIRTRTSYTASKKAVEPPKNTNETLARATAVPLSVTELPLRATAAPFAIPGNDRLAAVTLALELRQPTTPNASLESASITTDLQVSVFTTEGDNKGTQRSTAKVVLRPGTEGEATYETLSRIDLPPGRFRLRVAAHQESTAKAGTVMVDVVVPDFHREPASISGVALTATPGRPSAPRELLAKLLPVVPTTQRSFTTTEHATAFFCLYQTGVTTPSAAQIAIRIVDGRGATVVGDRQSVDGNRFTAAPAQARPSSPLRAAEFQYPLPLERLAPGPYLLTFEATLGTTVLRRDVQFEVR